MQVGVRTHQPHVLGLRVAGNGGSILTRYLAMLRTYAVYMNGIILLCCSIGVFWFGACYITM